MPVSLTDLCQSARTVEVNLEAFRSALLEELLLLAELCELGDELLERSSPCQGWTARQVLDHVAITPPMLIDGLSTHLGLAAPTPTVSGKPGFRLDIENLSGVLDHLDDDDLEGNLPGPIGMMPGRAVLSLALTELTLHRCDAALATGLDHSISAGHSEAVLATIIDWLLILSGTGEPPADPTAINIDPEGLEPHRLLFSAGTWKRSPNNDRHEGDLQINGDASELALFMAGRLAFAATGLTSSSDTSPNNIKNHLPGP